MAKRDNGGPAFPKPYTVNQYDGEQDWGSDGMALLDHFAGIALPLTFREMGTLRLEELKAKGYQNLKQAAAVQAYDLAQEMINVRSKWLAEEIALTPAEAVTQVGDPDCNHRWRDVFEPGKSKARAQVCVDCGAEA